MTTTTNPDSGQLGNPATGQVENAATGQLENPATGQLENPATGEPENPATTGQPSPEARAIRIGEVAELTGTTPRTIRYYEEIGLLTGGTEREIGKHRCYSRADIDRINEIVRLKELLGLSLEQLSQLLEAETARADIRREFQETDDPDRQHQLLLRSSGHIDTQLSLVRGRLEELTKLERELSKRAELVRDKLAALEEVVGGDQLAGARSGDD
jgi:DNA-binding transcriptional MerR regulator